MQEGDFEALKSMNIMGFTNT